MKRAIKYFFITIVSICLGNSQSLQDNLESMAKANAQGYLGPMVTAFGMGINSGIYHNAKPHKLLGFDFKLGMSSTSVSDAGKTFEFALPTITIPIIIDEDTDDEITYNIIINPDEVYSSNRISSTMFGAATSNAIEFDTDAAINSVINQLATQTGLSTNQIVDDTVLDDQIRAEISNIQTLDTPEGFNISAVPMIIPQISIGLPKDIELTLRGIPATELGDLGKLTFFGFGGKIGLNQFIPLPNIIMPHFSIGYYMTNLGVGDIMEMRNSITTLQVSKSLPILTVYGGFGFESSSLDVDYTYTDEISNTEIPVKFSLDGDNKFRTTVGARLKLAIISINADYNIGEFNTFNFGLGLTIR